MPDFSDLIGIPFIDGGIDIKKGLDCRGCFLEAMRRFGNNDIENKDISATDTKAIYAELKNRSKSNKWIQVEEPEPGDAVLLASHGSKMFFNHIGVCIENNKFIHTVQDLNGVIITRLTDPLWKNKIRGFYRWNNH